ncbi:MAG: hypothetical protein MUF50_01970, partial [Planctomycetes bacterium]|jgi:hypothetical protein|nr:hypothetical protein [Planctomycetota bacterium]
MDQNNIEQMKTNHDHNHDHGIDKEMLWQTKEPIFQQIEKMGFSEYANSLPEIEQAFVLKNKENATEKISCCCIDEGTPWGKHSAGSGVLLSDEELAQFVKDSQLTSFHLHGGCGANNLYAKEHGLSVEEVENYQRARLLKLGLKEEPYISEAEMKRPKGFHSARLSYYDGVGTFNWNNTQGLPEGFIITRNGQEKKSSLHDLSISLSIAFGDHGFGEKFTLENPYHIVITASNQEQAQELEKEVLEIVGNNDRVKVETWVK